MATNSYIKKRPCRICRKWFIPNPRVGDRQKTCGSKECKRKWHTRQCGRWNRKNRTYFQTIHLNKKLQAIQSQDTPLKEPPPPAPKSANFSKLPQEVIQEVIGIQQCVIAEYTVQVLLRHIQDALSKQRVDISTDARRLPP